MREEIERAMEELVSLLGEERVVQLARLIREVEERTGYGDVKIVIADGRVETMKQEHSFK